MTKLNIKFIITVAAIVFASIVIALGGVTLHKIKSLSDEIDYLNNKATRIEQDTDSILYRIDSLKNEIRQELEEQGKNYISASYKITDINTQSKTASVEIYFSLKESPLSGEVEVNYGKDGQLVAVPATNLVGGNYMAQVELDIDKDYEISYSASMQTIKTEKLLDINVYTILINRFNIDTTFTYILREKIKFACYLGNNYKNDDNLKVASVKLEIFKDQTLFETINLKDYNYQCANGYESCGGKEMTIDGLVADDYNKDIVSARLTVIDGYGIQYNF